MEVSERANVVLKGCYTVYEKSNQFKVTVAVCLFQWLYNSFEIIPNIILSIYFNLFIPSQIMIWLVDCLLPDAPYFSFYAFGCSIVTCSKGR